MMHGGEYFQMCCTTHGAWEVNLFSCIVQSMGHGMHIVLYSPWVVGKYTIVQPMVHEKSVFSDVLYSSCCMGRHTIVQPMVHGDMHIV